MYFESGCFLNWKLWELASRGLLSGFFKSDYSDSRHLAKFAEVVCGVVSNRRSLVSGIAGTNEVKGAFLVFDSNAPMCDGLVGQLTDVFFDSDDVPPPEFWMGMNGGKLISFVPMQYLDVVSEGIEYCMSGCLYWASDIMQSGEC